MKDNHYLFSMAVFCSILVMSIIFFIVLFVIIYRQKMIRIHLEKKQDEHNKNRELLKTRIEVREQTLNHIARELHDNIGQEVSTAKIILNNLDHKPKDIAETRLIVKESAAILDKVYEDLRLVSHSLKGYNIEEVGWIEAIEKELYYMREYGQINTRFKYAENEDVLFDLDADKSLLLFRIIQESLQNIVKHAQASIVEVNINYLKNADLLEISVKDNGIGMEVARIHKGMGMINMQQRIKILQGTMQIHAELNNGTTLCFSIPITDKEIDDGKD